MCTLGIEFEQISTELTVRLMHGALTFNLAFRTNQFDIGLLVYCLSTAFNGIHMLCVQSVIIQISQIFFNIQQIVLCLTKV